MSDRWDGWETLTAREPGELGRWRLEATYHTVLCQLWETAQKPEQEPFAPKTHDFFGDAPGRDGRCAGCGGKRTLCRFHLREAIDLGVDETTVELECSACGRFTTIEYYRDSS